MKKVTAIAAAIVLSAGLAVAIIPSFGARAEGDDVIELPIIPIGNSSAADDTSRTDIPDSSSPNNECSEISTPESRPYNDGGSGNDNLADSIFDSEIDDKKEPVKGDLNGDRIVNVTDLSRLAAYIKGKKDLPFPDAADINNSGKIDVTDLSKLAAHIKGKKFLG